jgi:hypothetical protein
MAKDHSLMIVHCLVPTSQTHTLDRVLQEIGAREIMFRPYQNGATPPATNGATEPKRRAKKPIGNAAYDGLSTVQKSQAQQHWLAKHINGKGEFTTEDLKPQWNKAGFGGHIYAALRRACDHKTIKKVSPGVYKVL